jgi:hypothetical protein
MKQLLLLIVLSSTVIIDTPEDVTICTITDNVVICN